MHNIPNIDHHICSFILNSYEKEDKTNHILAIKTSRKALFGSSTWQQWRETTKIELQLEGV
jgi:hypothetical protein